jgi:hypothetical protein
MIQNSIAIKKKHKDFIEEVTKNEIVWVLKSDKGLATSSSVKYEDENGEPIEIVCFWSNRKLASVCGKKYWKEYILTEMELSIFLENWCIGLYTDDWLVGTNFDWNLFGQENEPIELILEITEELQKKNKDLEFKKFKNIKDLKSQAKKIYEELYENEDDNE